MKIQKRIFFFDFLRGFAAFAVVIWHVGIPSSKLVILKTALMGLVINPVHLFFIMSGIANCISYRIEKDKKQQY